MNNGTGNPRAEGANRRILIVGMHTSVHVARWLRMIDREDAVIVVFPVCIVPEAQFPLPPGLRYISLSEVSSDLAPGLWVIRPTDVHCRSDTFVDFLNGYRRWRHSFLQHVVLAAPERLRECVTRFEPEVVHSMEVQLAGYLCLETARRAKRKFPPWILSNWGSDIALFRKLHAHQSRIREVCRRIDFYIAECARDHHVAKEYGYRGPTLPVIPASGGTNVEAIADRVRVRPSQRRKLLVKGYHGWSGRALLALSAVALAHNHLAGYQIEVSLVSTAVRGWVERIRAELDLDIRISPYLDDHDHAIERLAEARAVVGIGISDGISTTLLEAMAVGTLPIQSSTACADEWIEHGRSGFIVLPHDTRAIAEAIIQAVTDDALVDNAAGINLDTVKARWSSRVNGAEVWKIYDRAAAEHPAESRGGL
jgi:glycosyltransferase involved in cell wall biosynthesis